MNKIREKYEASRAFQLAMFHDIIELNNIRFTSPYVQSISGQEVCTVEVKSIKENDFFRIAKNPNIKEIRKKYSLKKYNDIILVGRNKLGELKGSINIYNNNKIEINYMQQELQEKIIDKNKFNRNFISEDVFRHNYSS